LPGSTLKNPVFSSLFYGSPNLFSRNGLRVLRFPRLLCTFLNSMEASTRRCWWFYIIACAVAYCFAFDYCKASEYTVAIPGAGTLTYNADTSNPTLIQYCNLSGSQSVYFMSQYGNYASGGIGNIGSILRTGNPQGFTFDGTTAAGTFSWPDLSAPDNITVTVHMTVKNPSWRSALWGISPGALSYNSLRQSVTTQDVVLTVPAETLIRFNSDADWAYESNYDPIYVTHAAHEFTRSVRLFPTVQVGKYKIRFTLLNYASSDCVVKIGSGTGGGTPTWLGEFTAKAAPTSGGATMTDFDILVDLPSDFDGFVFESAGHVINQFAPDRYPLDANNLNLFFRTIDIPDGFPPPSAGVSGNNSTVVVPPSGTPPTGGAVENGGAHNPQNTDTTNLPNAVNQATGNPSTPTTVGQGPNGMLAADNAALKAIEENTRATKDSMKAVDEYFKQNPNKVVQTGITVFDEATKDARNAVSQKFAIPVDQSSTLSQGIPDPGEMGPWVLQVPWLGRNLEIDINPLTNAFSAPYSVPLASFCKMLIAFSLLLYTWNYCIKQVSAFVDGMYQVPGYLSGMTSPGSSPIQQVAGAGINLFAGVGFRIAIATVIIMFIPAVVALIETGVGQSFLGSFAAVVSYLTTAKDLVSSGSLIFKAFVIACHVVPIATIFTCLMWRLVVIHTIFLFKPFVYTIVKYVNP